MKPVFELSLRKMMQGENGHTYDLPHEWLAVKISAAQPAEEVLKAFDMAVGELRKRFEAGLKSSRT